MANLTAAERHVIVARMKANLKESLGMDLPQVNATDVTIDDLLQIIDRMLIGSVQKGGKPAPGKSRY